MGKPTDDENEITRSTVSDVLTQAVDEGILPFTGSNESLFHKPMALFYDLGIWKQGLHNCTDAFGSGCLHAIAMKSNPLAPMLQKALELGFGVECASIGEVMHAQAIGFPPASIVYDSPCKTRAELRWALQEGLSMNIDNLDELQRVAELQEQWPAKPGACIGLRVNPLAGAGTIAALSVAVPDSKFGVPLSQLDDIVGAFEEHPWLNGIHVHTGSGGMALHTLVSGVRAAVGVALLVNKKINRRQVSALDIGGGLPTNYKSDAAAAENVPTFQEYAEALRREIPGLLSPSSSERLFAKVITEFGQSLNAKAAFLASRVEYVKPINVSNIPDGVSQVAVVHFGADLCVRQCYTQDHFRRLEVYDGATCLPKRASVTPQHIAGPLCFQGDMLARNIGLPRIDVDDFVVMRDVGANSYSLFSRHCSRQAPAIYGYKKGEQLIELKASETNVEVSTFWGGDVAKAEALAERARKESCFTRKPPYSNEISSPVYSTVGEGQVKQSSTGGGLWWKQFVI